MKKMKIIVLEVIMILTLVCGLVGCNKNDVSNKTQNINQNEVNNTMKEEVWNRRNLKEISGDYTLEEANLDNAFVVGADNLPQNVDALNIFVDDLGANIDSTLRVVMETPDSLLCVMDIEVSGDNFIVIQNNRQISGDITENVYPRNEYNFVDGVRTIDQDISLQMYSLAKENLEDSIELFAYIIEPVNDSGDIESEIIESVE